VSKLAARGLLLFLIIPATAKSGAAMPADGLDILGTHYSPRLKTLYDRVIAAHGKPIRVEAITGHVDNSIQVNATDIVVRLRPGSTEDNVAHELLHAMLQSEHYPQMFAVSILPQSPPLRALIGGDLDHLVINRRLLVLGYDPHRGFLSQADSYAGFLAFESPEDPAQRTVFQIGTVHELLKFHYYIRDPIAESAILRKHPGVAKLWREVKRAVDHLPRDPGPRDLWRVAATMNTAFDRLCAANKAGFRFSDLIGFQPVALTPADLRARAGDVFDETGQAMPDGRILARTFLRRDRMLVDVNVLNVDARTRAVDLGLPTSEFLAKRRFEWMPSGG
jgi:hypothetical protein